MQHRPLLVRHTAGSENCEAAIAFLAAQSRAPDLHACVLQPGDHQKAYSCVHVQDTSLCVNTSFCLQGTDQQKEEAAMVLLAVLETVRIVAVMLSPITPSLSRRVYEQLGYSATDYKELQWQDASWGGAHASLTCCLHLALERSWL